MSSAITRPGLETFKAMVAGAVFYRLMMATTRRPLTATGP
jgi:hypothetical protein